MEGIVRNSIGLRVRDRGYEVCYEEMYKPMNAGMYDNMCCRYKTESYGENELPKAVKRIEQLIKESAKEEGDDD